MGRSTLGVVVGVLVVILFTLITGLTFIPIDIAMWLPLLGFLLCCIIIGAVGQLRIFYATILSLLIFIGLMVFLAAITFLWIGVAFGPLELDRIVAAWTAFQSFLATLPFFPIFSDLALMIRSFFPDSMLAVFIEYFIAFIFVAIIGLLVTGVSAYFTRAPPLHVVTAPEVSMDMPDATISAVPAIEASSGEQAVPSALPSPSLQAEAPPQAVPAMPEPRPTEGSIPKGGAPSAQAISSLKGKVKKHLKGTGQKAPGGQARCPHCNETVIRGSRFCNACEREI